MSKKEQRIENKKNEEKKNYKVMNRDGLIACRMIN